MANRKKKKGSSRPQSAKATTRSNKHAGVGLTIPGGSSTTKPRNAAVRGSRMRADSNKAGSSSVPELRVVANEPHAANVSSDQEERRHLRDAERPNGSARMRLQADESESEPMAEATEARLLQAEARHQELEKCCRQLQQRCAKREADVSATKAELASYKAEVRSKSTAVGKAEIVLNEVCVAMASRLGRADGTRIAANKGRVLLEVHESPAEFAAVVKKNALLQLSKWEIDRAALQALAERAGDEAAVAAKVHGAERADLSAHALRLEEHIREMELDRERIATEAETTAQESRQSLLEAFTTKDALDRQLKASVARNEQLSKEFVNNEKEFQAQLDRFMEYPKAAEAMAKKLDKCQKSARRENNMVALERQEFRRQMQIFQKWQTENKDLRRRVKLQDLQAVTLRRQLAVAEAGLSGSSSTRKAVIGGTVDRLQRAEASAKHQAHKYRELAGSRGVRLAQLEREVVSLKATVQNLRRKQEAPANDSYETEIARLARTSPEMLEVQKKAGLSQDDMEASMAHLKVLREKEEHKDALIALVRERDEFEMCAKELKARTLWLEKQLLGSAGVFSSVAAEHATTVGESEEAERSRRAGTNTVKPSPAAAAVFGGWAGAEGKEGDAAQSRPTGGDVISRLEQQLELKERVAKGGRGLAPELNANIQRKIRFLQDCDWSIEKERERCRARESSAARNKHRGGGRGSGVAAVHAARARQRPHSAQASRITSSTGGLGLGLFRGGGGGGGRSRVSQDDSNVAVANAV